tara:strand:+ start:556 stop:1080 length:525 start_codon:yes stop_codon:yes gene_type:complete
MDSKVKDEIWNYCRVNDITNIEEFIDKMTIQGFNIEKYGPTPFEAKTIEVEVPVEKIVEKEVIKEVPVDKIVIKEVVKEVLVNDDEALNVYKDKISELSDKIKSLEENLNDSKEENEKLNLKTTDLEDQITTLKEQSYSPTGRRIRREVDEPKVSGKSSIKWVPKGGRDMYGDD